MRRAARWVSLRAAAARKLVTFAQVARHRLPIDVAFLTKGVGNPLRSFQDRLFGREAALRQGSGRNPVTCGIARNQSFGHRAHISPKSAGTICGNAKCRSDL